MANNISVKDASASTVVMKTTDNAGVHTSHVNVDNTVTVSGSVSLSGGIPAGSNAIGKLNANAGVTIGGVEVVGRTTNGMSIYRNIDVDETGVLVKGSAGVVYDLHLMNQGSAARYIKLYDKATAPTVGTDAPVMTVYLVGRSYIELTSAIGWPFSSGIGVGATTGVADADTGAPGANECLVNLLYK